ncbi:hypothetical protein PoB_000983900 [Plakobranchus ocellatus]|uniref:Uncharacterized protein n=1 Tax=Plakobranchus ocellatus TaxID=259542 RepID=A0AAV3YMP5_9GAST|nr:hypothetical protein PoB_000983900 [Plakobranchus ocellatus]
MILGFQALRQARALVAGLKTAEESPFRSQGHIAIHYTTDGPTNRSGRERRTLQTSRGYGVVAAVNNLTLAVGYVGNSGIDLIDLGGQVLRQIFPQIEYPRGVAITTDGSIPVTDINNKTLHLVSSQGVWVKQLWPTSSSNREDIINGCDNNADIAHFRILAMVSYFLRLLLGKREDIIIETNEAYLESSSALGADQGSIFHITYYISALTNPEIWMVLKSPAKRNVSKLPAIQSYMGKSAVVIVQCADVLAASQPRGNKQLDFPTIKFNFVKHRKSNKSPWKISIKPCTKL